MTRTGPRGGFTLVGLLVVTAVLAILAGLAVPWLQRAILRARAVEVLENIEVVRNGALEYLGAHGRWPPEAPRGTLPPGLHDFLPEGFSLVGSDHVLDWENFSGRDGGFVGITVVTDDPDVSSLVLSRLGRSGTWSDGGNRIGLVLKWK